ncbi:MAG: hypothetical protein ACKO2L_03300, partial [Planctomycetaceae bacterium]
MLVMKDIRKMVYKNVSDNSSIVGRLRKITEFRQHRHFAAWSSRMAAACGQTALKTTQQRSQQRAHLRCETQPGASAQPLLHRNPSRMAAACGQTALKTTQQRTQQRAHLRCE